MSTDTKPFDWRVHLKVHPAADLFPLMSEAELQALADDLKRTGKLQHSIVLAEDGRLLDGRNRLDALVLIGSLKAGKTGKGLTGLRFAAGEQHQLLCDVQPGDPYEAVLSFNLHRRHLTGEQKREVIAKVLKAKPEQSNRAIAKQVKADHKTVADVRREAEGRGEIPHVETRADSRGRAQPATKPKPARQDIEENTEEAEDNGGFMLAVIGGAAKSASIVARNLHHPLTEEERSAAVAAIDRVIENWRRIKDKVRSGELGGDADIQSFDIHVFELLQLTKGQKPQHFAKTAVPLPVLGDLAYFIRELVSVRELANEGADHDASASEQRKADYAASEVADKDLNIPDYLRRTRGLSNQQEKDRA
jgi:hypothetical protein